MIVLLLGLAAAVVAGFGIALLDLTIRRGDVGAALVFLSPIVQAAFLYNDVPSVRLGGMRVGVTDLVAAIVLAAGLARCLRLRSSSRPLRWLVLLGGLLLVSLVLGITTHGVQTSLSDSRQYLFFVGAALYMATFRPTPVFYDRIGRIWLVTAVLMVLLACVRWLHVFAGIDLGVPAEQNGVDTAIRVLDGPYAFFLAGALLLTVPSWLQRGQARWVRRVGAVLLVVVIMLDRRTVWLAILVGVAVLLLRGRRLGPRAVVLVVAAAVLITVAFIGDVLLRDQAPPGTVSSTGSVGWRIEGWSDLVASWSESPANWLIGEPFGGGFARTVEGSQVTAHPHNFFIETMIRAGVGGLIALLALSVGLLRRLWRVRVTGVGLFDPGVLAPMLAMQLVWYITWVPGLEQGVVTGMAIAVAATRIGRGGAPPRAPAIPGPPDPGRWGQVHDVAAGSAPPGSPATRSPVAAPTPSRDVTVGNALPAAVQTLGRMTGPDDLRAARDMKCRGAPEIAHSRLPERDCAAQRDHGAESRENCPSSPPTTPSTSLPMPTSAPPGQALRPAADAASASSREIGARTTSPCQERVSANATLPRSGAWRPGPRAAESSHVRSVSGPTVRPRPEGGPFLVRPADVPLLMIAFNRPEKTRRVFDAVRAAAPRRLYLAADGPRADVPSDVDRCERTRHVLDDVDWPCEVQRLYQPENLGCKRGVGAAIDWFLACEESGIILEDDCLPTADFFPFCAELLERYRTTPEVMMIGGHNPLGRWDAGEGSYLFSRTAPIWGWATWRRAWQQYDPAMTRWGEPEARALVRSRMPQTEYRITAQRFDSVYEGRRDTWDYGWALAILISGGVSVMPSGNLIANIGFDTEATHTRRPSRHESAVPTHPVERPLRHPSSTRPDDRFERVLFKNRFPLGRRLVAALPTPAQDRLRAAVYFISAATRRVRCYTAPVGTNRPA